MISGFTEGLEFWWRGWGYILRHRRLFLLSLIPFLLSTLFAAGAIWLLWSHLSQWAQNLVAVVMGLQSGFIYNLVYYPLIVGGGALFFFSAIYVTFLLHTLLAMPFYSLLAEQTLLLIGMPTSNTWRNAFRMVRVSLVKGILLLLAGFLLFIFSFIPVLNILAIICALLIMAFDCMDYSFDCLGYGVSERLFYLLRERRQWLGMAVGLALTLLVPGLTLIITPGAVVGSALILKDHQSRESQ